MCDLIKDNETLDDLQVNDLYVIQKENGFRFGIDAILLANYPNIKRGDFVADFCSGSGVISILAVGKRGAKGAIQFEVQDQYCEMAQRTIKYNKLSDALHEKGIDCRLLDEVIDSRTNFLKTCLIIKFDEIGKI